MKYTFSTMRFAFSKLSLDFSESQLNRHGVLQAKVRITLSKGHRKSFYY